jgi:hypothetical protein
MDSTMAVQRVLALRALLVQKGRHMPDGNKEGNIVVAKLEYDNAVAPELLAVNYKIRALGMEQVAQYMYWVADLHYFDYSAFVFLYLYSVYINSMHKYTWQIKEKNHPPIPQ